MINKIKKIGISCHALKHSGGMERYAMDLVRGMSALGIRPVFFAKKFNTTLVEYSMVDACRISVSWLPQKLRDHYFSWRLKKKKAELGVDMLISCTRVSCSEVAICGGTHIGFLRAMGRRAGWANRRQILLEREQYASARHVVAHSQAMVNELREDYGLAAEKISLLYPPVDMLRFSTVSDAQRAILRRELDFPPDKVIFLFASSSHERKGLPALAEFFKQTDLPVVLVIVGRPIHFTAPNIRYLGFRSDMAACYQAADFTILASHYEPFGLVAIESVLCGTPVVMTEQTGCLEILSDEAKLVFNTQIPSSLGKAIVDAVAKARQGARLVSPIDSLRVDLSIATHLQSLLVICEQVVRPSLA